MDRKEFIKSTVKMGLCCSGALVALASGDTPLDADPGLEKELKRAKQTKNFIENWLVDLLNGMEEELDEKTIVKLMSACGRGCFRRHKFKTDIAEQGKGDVDKLLKAMTTSYNVRREGNLVHVDFGKGAPGCYCPVLKENPSKLNSQHCHCTRSTIQAIWETALNRPIKIDIVETFRRGGNTCHFIVHLD